MNKKNKNILSPTLKQAIRYLESGECIGLPTETVYGLAADACCDETVLKIFQIKGRPAYNPLIIHVDSILMALEYGVFNETAQKLATKFWLEGPLKPLTLVVQKKNQQLSQFVTAGLDTVGIRMPHHPLAITLISHFGKPLAAPSANKSNYISPTTPKAVMDDLGTQVPLVIDGGTCQFGLESTILDVTNEIPYLLRSGSVLPQEIIDITGNLKTKSSSATIIAPGMLSKHYSPRKPIRINVNDPAENEGYLGFGNCKCSFLNLSPTGNLEEAALNLYAMLRILDTSSFPRIAVAPIPHHDIGIALNDRLTRACGKEQSQ